MHLAIDESMFFTDWASLGRTLLVGVLAYIALILILRTSGKRTLSKMNAFDFIVTIAIGSTLASILINRNVALAEGVLALALIVALQYVITWVAVRSRAFGNVIKSNPRLLLHNGEPLAKPMRDERIMIDELEAAARASGIENLANVRSIILETDGTLTVIASENAQ